MIKMETLESMKADELEDFADQIQSALANAGYTSVAEEKAEPTATGGVERCREIMVAILAKIDELGIEEARRRFRVNG